VRIPGFFWKNAFFLLITAAEIDDHTFSEILRRQPPMQFTEGIDDIADL
jgi:hypothetical protein